jgi:hypothetical protein
MSMQFLNMGIIFTRHADAATTLCWRGRERFFVASTKGLEPLTAESREMGLSRSPLYLPQSITYNMEWFNWTSEALTLLCFHV